MSRVQSSISKDKKLEQINREKKLKQAFDVFDQNLNGTVDTREVGTILRSIGVYPSLLQLNQWVTEMEDDEPSGYITWKRFNAVASNILSGKYPVKDDEETLFRAFQVLDVDKKGFLLPDELRKFMTTMGEEFADAEIDEMLAACTEPTENKIYYEDYCRLIS